MDNEKYKELIQKILDNTKFYSKMQVDEYARNLEYDYAKWACIKLDVIQGVRDEINEINKE